MLHPGSASDAQPEPGREHAWGRTASRGGDVGVRGLRGEPRAGQAAVPGLGTGGAVTQGLGRGPEKPMEAQSGVGAEGSEGVTPLRPMGAGPGDVIAGVGLQPHLLTVEI
ncbi:IgGFc-binding protein-like [Platysternon megacephalum]|uniref:IgGFc-binding protein-like n=1 Tax=Platysternon megacephalum TaxID=55544 RepID=A0A4D9DP42_9SAUR|nr:IgGFc-binding protein-like [Platysternon megacephalum]